MKSSEEFIITDFNSIEQCGNEIEFLDEELIFYYGIKNELQKIIINARDSKICEINGSLAWITDNEILDEILKAWAEKLYKDGPTLSEDEINRVFKKLYSHNIETELLPRIGFKIDQLEKIKIINDKEREIKYLEKSKEKNPQSKRTIPGYDKIKWYGTEPQLIDLFVMLNQEGFIPKYSKDEIHAHFINEKGIPFLKSITKKILSKIHWQGTETQFVYLFEQLVEAGFLSKYFFTTESGYSLLTQHFENKQRKPFKNTQLANTFQNLGTNKKTPGKPKGADKIDKVISKTKRKM